MRLTAMVGELFKDRIGSLETLLQLPVLVVMEDLLEETGFLRGKSSGWRNPGRRHGEGEEESKESEDVEPKGGYGWGSHSSNINI